MYSLITYRTNTIEFNHVEAVIDRQEQITERAEEGYKEIKQYFKDSDLLYDPYFDKTLDALYESFDAIEKAQKTIAEAIEKTRKALEDVRKQDEEIQEDYGF